MEIKEYKSKKEWDGFLIENGGTFLQSILWGDFKNRYQKVVRLEARENGKITGVCQLFNEKSYFGDYYYIPHGPFSKKEEVRERLFLAASDIGKKEKKIFVSAEPLQSLKIGKRSFFRIQPQKTLISNIEDEPEEIKEGFSKSTRYNIGYAERKGVITTKSGDVDSFFKLLKETKTRQKFNSYPKEYFQDLLEISNTELVLAVYNGKVVAGIILIYFGETVSFLHSALDYNTRNLKAAALLRFDSIKLAKEKNCKFYDFWGIDEKKFPGVTEYKKSFGGSEVKYPEGRSIAINNLAYGGYKFLSAIKEKIR